MVTRGGARRPHKPAGRGSQAKAFRAYLRQQVNAGMGHAADGSQLGTERPERRSAKELVAGYKPWKTALDRRPHHGGKVHSVPA